MGEINRKDISEVVKDELFLAAEELRSFKVTFDAGVYRKSVSNLYYFLFHMTKAVLASKGIFPGTHEGVERMLAYHFVRSGDFPPSVSTYYANLMSRREEADYKGFITFNRADVITYTKWILQIFPFYKNVLKKKYLKFLKEDVEEILNIK
jgi:uncharacterized protein (UPF0332 family)